MNTRPLILALLASFYIAPSEAGLARVPQSPAEKIPSQDDAGQVAHNSATGEDQKRGVLCIDSSGINGQTTWPTSSGYPSITEIRIEKDSLNFCKGNPFADGRYPRNDCSMGIIEPSHATKVESPAFENNSETYRVAIVCNGREYVQQWNTTPSSMRPRDKNGRRPHQFSRNIQGLKVPIDALTEIASKASGDDLHCTVQVEHQKKGLMMIYAFLIPQAFDDVPMMESAMSLTLSRAADKMVCGPPSGVGRAGTRKMPSNLQ